ncbi:MAG: SpoIVB peptidase [Eubacteriales bacterium]|nr:SpoIVB peptidase [Eubacteriales bacterium]
MRQSKKQIKRIAGWALSLALLALNYSSPVKTFFSLPDTLNLQLGQSQGLNLGFSLPAQPQDANVLGVEGDTLGGDLQLDPVSCGNTQLELKLFGLVPVKKIDVVVSPQKMLIPGGQSIGVAMQTNGVLVVGRSDIVSDSDVVTSPARDSDLRPGDVILAVDGQQVENSEHLARLVEKYDGGDALQLSVQRDAAQLTIPIQPLRDKQDGSWRLGVWVRDSTAGVGTLTYYDPDDGNFGALGHAITDLDTGALLSVKQGLVLYSHIVDVQLGTKGAPGELKGYFTEDTGTVGSIVQNTRFGIYGKAVQKLTSEVYQQPIPVAPQSAVVTGPAQILSTVDGDGVKAYDVTIIRVTPQSQPAAKGMVIEVTDPTLLKRTGGIVQGMSGSPIIQNGCIIGAVTHVFINDPTRGHGIFIEWMLETEQGGE